MFLFNVRKSFRQWRHSKTFSDLCRCLQMSEDVFWHKQNVCRHCRHSKTLSTKHLLTSEIHLAKLDFFSNDPGHPSKKIQWMHTGCPCRSTRAQLVERLFLRSLVLSHVVRTAQTICKISGCTKSWLDKLSIGCAHCSNKGARAASWAKNVCTDRSPNWFWGLFVCCEQFTNKFCLVKPNGWKSQQKCHQMNTFSKRKPTEGLQSTAMSLWKSFWASMTTTFVTLIKFEQIFESEKSFGNVMEKREAMWPMWSGLGTAKSQESHSLSMSIWQRESPKRKMCSLNHLLEFERVPAVQNLGFSNTMWQDGVRNAWLSEIVFGWRVQRRSCWHGTMQHVSCPWQWCCQFTASFESSGPPIIFNPVGCVVPKRQRKRLQLHHQPIFLALSEKQVWISFVCSVVIRGGLLLHSSNEEILSTWMSQKQSSLIVTSVAEHIQKSWDCKRWFQDNVHQLAAHRLEEFSLGVCLVSPMPCLPKKQTGQKHNGIFKVHVLFNLNVMAEVKFVLGDPSCLVWAGVNSTPKQSRSNPQLLVNSNNEIYSACRHRSHSHRHAKQTTPSTDESINDKRASPTHEVTTDFSRCNVCLVGVWLEALWGPTKRNRFLFISRALALETIPTICYESVTLCCSVQHCMMTSVKQKERVGGSLVVHLASAVVDVVPGCVAPG